jgi:mRNA-degrading endonuclease RelE of RelBE toxin-antitoxin system
MAQVVSYRLIIERKAEQDAVKIPHHLRASRDKAIFAPAQNPRPRSSKKITDKDGYRGDRSAPRLMYTMNKRNKVIGILFWLTVMLGVSLLSLPSVPNAFGASDKEVQTIVQADLAAQSNPEGLMVSLGGFRRWIRGTDKDLSIRHVIFKQVRPGLPRLWTGIRACRMAPLSLQTPCQYDSTGSMERTQLASFPQRHLGRPTLMRTERKMASSRLLIRPTLYAKAGPVIIVNQTDLAYFHFTGKGPYFLEWTYETLLQDGDHVIENRTNFCSRS